MSARHVQTFGLVVFFTVLLSLPNTTAVTRGQTEELPSEWVWTNWGAAQYTLADDGQSIWIGGTGSVLEWEKESGSSRRYGPTAGLRHARVLAVAVDSAGNRWFGGDGGLSHLSPEGDWTHYTVENSALPTNLVDGIAVGAKGTLWLSHGLPDGALSRWDADGGRQWYPSRQAAVSLDYSLVQGTQNTNELWTVAGDEVWVGYDVYDGLTWTDRRPPQGSDLPLALRVDSQGTVWALERYCVLTWDGNNWVAYPFLEFMEGTGNALAIGPDDSIWVGWTGRSFPYTNYGAGISHLSAGTGTVESEEMLWVSGPVTALLPTPGGVWGIGPGWLLQPDQTVARVKDEPFFRDVTEVVLTSQSELFVHSLFLDPYAWGSIQLMDDRATTTLGDDAWQSSTGFPVLTAAERAPDGSLWLGGYPVERFSTLAAPLRYHPGSGWIEVVPPFLFRPLDIFAEDGRHTWFAYRDGVLYYDDGGSPANQADDRWRHYPIEQAGEGGTVAVDAVGRLWYGNSSGLFQYQDTAWVPIEVKLGDIVVDSPVCELVPAGDGTLFVQLNRDCSAPVSDWYVWTLIIRPDGTQDSAITRTLIEEEFHLVTTASHRNRRWTVAPDGAIWYLEVDALSPPRIERYGGANWRSYNLPFAGNVFGNEPLEVDANNHLWMVAAGQLWRLSPRPDFQLEEASFLLAPGTSRGRTIGVQSIGGYTEPVLLDLLELPAGVTAAFEPNPVPAGETTTLTMTAEEGVSLGAYYPYLHGTDGVITHTVSFTLAVVPEVTDLYLPLLATGEQK